MASELHRHGDVTGDKISDSNFTYDNSASGHRAAPVLLQWQTRKGSMSNERWVFIRCCGGVANFGGQEHISCSKMCIPSPPKTMHTGKLLLPSLSMSRKQIRIHGCRPLAVWDCCNSPAVEAWSAAWDSTGLPAHVAGSGCQPWNPSIAAVPKTAEASPLTHVAIQARPLHPEISAITEPEALELPQLTAPLLNIEAEMKETSLESAILSSGEVVAASEAHSASSASDDAAADARIEPPNVGHLAEEYVAAWLPKWWSQRHGSSCSVRWLNEMSEQHSDHDLELSVQGESTCRHVEVKSRWQGCSIRGNTLSKAQKSRLLDPSDKHKYMVIVVGDMHGLFSNPVAPPRRIQIFRTSYKTAWMRESHQNMLLRQKLCTTEIAKASAGTEETPYFRFCVVDNGSTGRCWWGLELEEMDAALADPVANAKKKPDLTVRHPSNEFFQGPPSFKDHDFHCGDDAYLVKVDGMDNMMRWEFWLRSGTILNFVKACSFFNQLCRQFCRFHTIRQTQMGSDYNVEDVRSWEVSWNKVMFDPPGDPKRDSAHMSPNEPYLRSHNMSDVVFVSDFDSMEEAVDRHIKTMEVCSCYECLLRRGARHKLLAEWRWTDSGRYTGLMQKKYSVVGYSLEVPTHVREDTSHVRQDNIDHEERRAVYY